MSLNETTEPLAVVSPETEGGLLVQKTLTIKAGADELYRFWRDFARLPEFMKHVEAVTVSDDTHSHWVVKGPARTHVEWDAELVDDQPGKRIAWRSLPGAEVANAGEVLFWPAPQDRGTEVRVILSYDPPGGKLGAAVARLFNENPAQQLDDDLRRFKQIVETGRIVTTDGQPTGPRKRSRKKGSS